MIKEKEVIEIRILKGMGLTNVAIARRLGYNRKTIARYLRGKWVKMLKEIIQQYLENDNEALMCLLKFFLEKVMNVEITEQTGAIPYQKASGRIAHRNGYKKTVFEDKSG